MNHRSSLSYSGRGIKIAIIDSGIDPSHPHIKAVAGGVRIAPDGTTSSNYLDYNGHGTAVTAVIREKAPDALLYAVKIFDRSLTTNIETTVRALEWAIENEMMVVNLSLGTNNQSHRRLLQDSVDAAVEKKIVVVSASHDGDCSLFPGSLPGVVGVGMDSTCPRDRFRLLQNNGEPVFIASDQLRTLPGISVEPTRSGVSFAVAAMTGFVALAREIEPDTPVSSLKSLLIQMAESFGTQ
jgi:subtilisin family serine protease